MKATGDVKSFTSSYLQSLFFSPSLVYVHTRIRVASFYLSLCDGNSRLSCLFKQSYLKSAISDRKVKERKKLA